LFGSDADCIADAEVEFGGSKFSIFENAFGKTGVCAPHAGDIIRYPFVSVFPMKSFYY